MCSIDSNKRNLCSHSMSVVLLALFLCIAVPLLCPCVALGVCVLTHKPFCICGLYVLPTSIEDIILQFILSLVLCSLCRLQ
jgi:hypothetical protein